MAASDPLEVTASWAVRILASVLLGTIILRRAISVARATAAQIERLIRRLYE
jgi:hypothetical protein